MQLLYIVESAGKHKIGYTTKSIQSRLSAMRTGNPLPINLVFTFEDEKAIEIEKCLHYKYRELRLSGEWFNLSSDDVNDILQESKEGFGRIVSPEKIDKNNFIKLMHKHILFHKHLLEKIGASYLGYLNILISQMDYNNTVNFDVLKGVGLTRQTVYEAKKKYKDAGIIIEDNGIFYVNPKLYHKGDSVDKRLADLFANIEL